MQEEVTEEARRRFVDEFFYLLDDGKDLTLNSTCETSEDCDGEGVMSKCCVSIEISRESTGQYDKFNRCMIEEVIQ